MKVVKAALLNREICWSQS